MNQPVKPPPIKSCVPGCRGMAETGSPGTHLVGDHRHERQETAQE